MRTLQCATTIRLTSSPTSHAENASTKSWPEATAAWRPKILAGRRSRPAPRATRLQEQSRYPRPEWHAPTQDCGQATGQVGHPRLGDPLSLATPDRREDSKARSTMADSGAQITVVPATPLSREEIAVAGLSRPHVGLQAANDAKIDAQGDADATINAPSPSGVPAKYTCPTARSGISAL